MPAGVRKGAEFAFRQNPTDVGTRAANDTKWFAGLHDRGPPTYIVSECLSDYVDGGFGVAENEPLGLTSCPLPFEECYGASCMGVQTIADPRSNWAA